MISEDLPLQGLKLITIQKISDNRGAFMETFSEKTFKRIVCNTSFVQDNESISKYGVLRGLHFQKSPYEQSKLVRVVKGSILDVAVDIRLNSPTFGKHISVELSEYNNLQLFIPKGFAHGFVALTDNVVMQYKCDNYYNKESESGIIWNDPDLSIDWRIPKSHIILSEKDTNNLLFKDLEHF